MARTTNSSSKLPSVRLLGLLIQTLNLQKKRSGEILSHDKASQDIFHPGTINVLGRFVRARTFTSFSKMPSVRLLCLLIQTLNL